MLTDTSRWSHAPGNQVVPSPWQVPESPRIRPARAIYCAHFVPRIFTLGRQRPCVEVTFPQVRRYLPSATTSCCPAGIDPGLQASPSALPQLMR